MTPPTADRLVPARVIVQLDPHAFGPDVPAGTRVTTDDAAVEFRTAADAVVPRPSLIGVEPTPDGLRLIMRAGRPWQELAVRVPSRIDTPDPGPALRLFVDGGTYRALTAAPVRAEWSRGKVSVGLDDAVRPTGFDVADALLPADPREPEAVRLLGEWAVCPEKLLFVDVAAPASLPGVDGDLRLDLHATAPLDTDQLRVRLGCVPAVNRRVVDLPPVPLRRPGEAVRLDVDPLSAIGSTRVVMDVIRARAVRAGRTVTTYAERLAPLPPSLAVQAARVGEYELHRRGDEAWLSLTDRRPPGGGRTLLVTAACCRHTLPDGPLALSPGVAAVTPVRPPVWVVEHSNPLDLCQLLPKIVASAAGLRIGPVSCVRLPATVEVSSGVAHGVELRVTIDPGELSADEVYLLARVLDHAAAAAAAVHGFTRTVVTTPTATKPVATCPPRAGKVPLPGRYSVGESPLPSDQSDVPETGGPVARASRSAEQRATLTAAFAGVTRPTSVVSLAAVLRHLLGVPVSVVPFQPARAAVPVESQLRLGGNGRHLSPTTAAWGVRVDIGPLDLRTFARLGPGTRASRRVRQLLDATVGPAATVRPILRSDQVPAWRLGDGRLARTLWLPPRTPPAAGLPAPVPEGT